VSALTVRCATTSDGYRIAYTVEGSGPCQISFQTPFHHVLRIREISHIAKSIAEAAKQITLVHFDLRGQGLSTRGLPADHCWERYQNDVDAVVGALGVDRFSILAPGALAGVALHLAARHPERVAALTLFNANVRLGVSEPRAEPLLSLAEKAWEYFLEVIARTNVPTDRAEAIKDLFRSCATQADYLRMMRTAVDYDVAQYLPCVEAPTLVITGRAGTNAFATEEVSKELAARIPNAELILMDEYSGDRVTPTFDFLRRVGWLNSPSTLTASGLSARELEVLRLVALGHSNQQIASALTISPSTVAKHVNSILAKTGSANRTAAAALVHDRAIGDER
jgi:pimeloyl-ACP methyl ester carboxylesterase/DNA-binding CsgD family transcriptional regulator